MFTSASRRIATVVIIVLTTLACEGRGVPDSPPHLEQDRSFRFVLGPVEILGSLLVRDTDPLMKIVLSVTDPELDRRTTYEYQEDLVELGSRPCELWMGERFMYEIELHGSYSWLELMQDASPLEDHLVVTKVMGAAEE